MAKRDIHDLLVAHPFFEGVDEAVLAELAGCGTNVVFKAGDWLLREGAEADRLYLIREGRVALELAAPDRDTLVIDTLGPGDLLGVSWLVTPHRWAFDGQAIEPTRAVALDASCLRMRCDADPALGYEIMGRVAQVLQQRLRSARVRLLDVYSHAR
jgi:CRP/FNR family transcriptional regulator, cyclic AMP receptor protein